MMKRGTARWIAFATTLLFVVFFLYPAWTILRQAFVRADGGFTLEAFGLVFRDPLYREGLVNAFGLGAASTAVSLAIAFPLALIAHRHDFPGKKWLGALILAPMILPPFIGAVGVKQILGVEGALNALLQHLGWMEVAQPFDWLAHGRFGGMVLMNALHLYPILYLNIAAALANLDPAMEQAAENLGCPPWRRFWKITLPLAMPGVFAGASIVFIWAFTELGVPLVFDFGRVAPVQIYDGIKGLDRNPIPYALASVLMLSAAAVFVASKRVLGKSRLGSAARPAGRMASQPARGVKGLLCTTTFGGVFFIACLPHLGVVLLSLAEHWYGSILPEHLTTRHFVEALGNGLVVPSIQNSLLYATGATVIALVAGLGIAWVVVRSDLKWRGLLDALAMLPLAVPGLVMAFGYLALSQEGKPFHFLVGGAGNPFFLLVAAYAIRRLPYVVRSAAAGLQQANPVLEEAARSLGATSWRMLRRVALPLIGANLAAGGILAFAFAMMEVSDSLILAQQAQHYPITKAIYTLLSTLGNGTALAAALGVWSMVFLAVALIGAGRIGGKRGGWFRL